VSPNDWDAGSGPEPHKSLHEFWPDPDRRDAALQRVLESTYGRRVMNGKPGARRQPFRDPSALTPFELRCVIAASHGLTDAEIGTVVGVGVETVKTQLKGARRRLAAKNTTHAVAICLRKRLIS
jgi:DNA-binding CsgD family transcriptional regulator